MAFVPLRAVLSESGTESTPLCWLLWGQDRI